MCYLATEAVFAEAVVVVELDECLRGVGVGAWEVGKTGNFVVLLCFELAEKVKCVVLQLFVATYLWVVEQEWYYGIDNQ